MGALLVNEVVALFVVGGVTLVVWIGIFAYLWRLDRRVRSLERDVERQEPE